MTCQFLSSYRVGDRPINKYGALVEWCGQGKQKYSKKKGPISTTSNMNGTWRSLGPKSGLQDHRTAKNRQRYDMVWIF